MLIFLGTLFIRAPGVSAFIHPIWILSALVFGVAAGYLGLLRYLEVRGEGALLPGLARAARGRFNLRAHITFALIYLTLLFSALLWGIWTARHFRGATQRSFHFYLGLIIVILYAIGAVIGLFLKRGIKPRRKWAFIHMCFNYSACTLLLVQVIIGLLLLREYL